MTEKILDVDYFIQYYQDTTTDFPFGRILDILGPDKLGISLLILDDKTRKKLIISDGDVIRVCNPNQKPIPMYEWYPFYKSPAHYPRNSFYGFFSVEAVKKGLGTAIYLTTDGKEVEITSVCRSEDKKNYEWRDFVCVGEVTKWIRPGRKGKYDDDEGYPQ